MMGSSVERIIRLTVDGTSAARQLEQIARSSKKTENALDKLGSGLKTIGAVVSVGMVVQGFRNFTDALDEMGKASERFGVSSEWLSGMGHAAEMSGVQFDKFKIGLKDFTKNLALAESGSKQMSEVMDSLGITATGDVEQALAQLADRFAELPDGPQKAQAAMKVFGQAGLELIPMLNAGSAGIEEMRAEAERLGLIMDSKAAAAAAAFNDNLARVSAAAKGTSNQFVQGMLPALAKITESFTDVNVGADRWQKLGRGAGEIARWTAGAFYQLAGMVEIAGSGIAAVLAAIATRSTDPFKAWLEDIDRVDNEVRERMKKLTEEYKAPEARKPTGSFTNPAEATRNDAIKESLRQLSEMERAGTQITSEYATEQEKLFDKLGELQSALEAGVISWETYERGISATNQKLLELNPEYQRYLKLYEDGLAVTESVATNEERHARELERLQELLAACAIDVETFNRAVEKLNSTYSAPENSVDKTKEFGDTVANLAGGALRDVFRDTENAGQSMLRFAERIAEAAAEVLIITPLIEALQATLKGSSLGGFLGLGTRSAQMAFSTPSGGNPYARGGAPGGSTLFPLSSGGGFSGGAGQEALMSLGSVAGAGAGSGVTVNVINQSGSEVETNERRGPNDERIIDVLVHSAVERAIGSGKFDRTFSSVYGVNRRGRK